MKICPRIFPESLTMTFSSIQENTAEQTTGITTRILKQKTKCTNRKELKKVYKDEKERKGRKNYDQRTKHENNQNKPREKIKIITGEYYRMTLYGNTQHREEKRISGKEGQEEEKQR